MSFELFIVVMIAATLVVRFMPRVPDNIRIPLAILVFLAFLCWAPFELGSYRSFQISRVAVFGIAVMGLNVLTGYNGQISLGQGAFVALGAYCAALLMDGESQMGFIDGEPWPWWAAIIVAGIVPSILGLGIGIPALRLSGPYLAIATLALMIAVPSILRKYDDFTGGTQGVFIDQPDPPGFLDFLERDEFLYFMALGYAVLMFGLAWAFLRGPIGRAFVAVRDSETAAAAMGINVARTKVLAFTIAAFYGGISGGVYAQITGVVTPDSIDIVQSIQLLTAIVIGGLASIVGSIIGAAVLVFLPSDGPSIAGWLPFLSADTVDRAPGAIQGVLVILAVIFMPSGIVGLFGQLRSLKPGDIVIWLEKRPAAVRGWASRVREDIQWWYEDLPWRRPPVPRDQKPEGG